MQVTFSESLGYIAAILVFLTFSMKTMVPLRVVAIASNIFFIAYGYMQPAYPLLILHAALLPLNLLRLRQMLSLIREIESAAKGDLNLDWLKPFTTRQAVGAGEFLFRKGEQANALYFVISGALKLPEIGLAVGPGDVVGELGLLSPDQIRTQTVQAVEPTDLLKITYDQIMQLYYQNPKFGFFFLQLSSRRLFENLQRLEAELAHGRKQQQT